MANFFDDVAQEPMAEEQQAATNFFADVAQEPMAEGQPTGEVDPTNTLGLPEGEMSTMMDKPFGEESPEYMEFMGMLNDPNKREAANELLRRHGTEGLMGVAALRSQGQQEGVEAPTDGEAVKAIGRFALDTMKNTPGSAYKFGKEMVNMAKHPVETGEAIGKLAIGGAQKLVPGDQGFEKYFDGVVDTFKEDYKDIPTAIETARKDPIKVAGDMAAMMSLVGGGLLRGTQAGKTIAKGAASLEPTSAIANMAKQAVTKTAPLVTGKLTPQGMYKSAVKLSNTIKKPVRDRIIESALKYDIMPNASGLDKAWSQIGDISRTIDDKIVKASDPQTVTKMDELLNTTRLEELTGTGPKAGSKAPKMLKINELFKGFDELKEKARLSSDPEKALNAYDRIEESIKKANFKIGRDEFTVENAQQLKKTIYKEIKKNYESKANDPHVIKAQKQVANNAKSFIEDVIPEIKELNKTDGDLLALVNALENPAENIAKTNFFGLGTSANVGLGSALGYAVGSAVPGAAFGVGLSLLQHPIVKSKLAILLNKLEKSGVKLSDDTKNLMIGLQEARHLSPYEEDTTQETD